MELRPGYKQTEAGVIPEDWEAVSLGKKVQITSGDSPSNLIFETVGLRYFKVEQLGWDSKYLESTPYRIRSQRSVPAGSVVFAKRGAAIRLNKIRILQYPSFMDTNLMALTPDDSLSNEYLHYALNHRNLWDIADVTSVPQINNKHIVPLRIPLPSRTEQHAIAEALSDADALIESMESLIAKKRLIKQGAMQELLTGKRRLPGFEGEWGSVKFEDAFHFLRTATNPRNDLSAFAECFYVHYGDIHTKFHGHLDFGRAVPPRIDRVRVGNAAQVRNGDWIMADASEDYDGVGKSVEVVGLPPDAICFAGLHTFLLRERTLLFAPGFKGHLGSLHSLHQEYLRVSTGMKVYGVSKTALRELQLPVPPISEQAAIAAILTDMDDEIEALQQRLDKTRQIKQGMMQQLLSGRIRLI